MLLAAAALSVRFLRLPAVDICALLFFPVDSNAPALSSLVSVRLSWPCSGPALHHQTAAPSE